MAIYFFDSSALVKRYAAESGSIWVQHVTDPKSGNKIYISTITGVELVSALMKKVRSTQSPLLLSDAQKAIADFRNDFDNQYELFGITDSLIRRAMGLPVRHKLRAYDAVQLAAALTIDALSAQLGIAATGVPPLVIATCDDELLEAAKAEGLVTDDPRAHP